MGNKAAKKVSTELTEKGLFICWRRKVMGLFALEIALLKANTKYSEKGKCESPGFSSHFHICRFF